MTRIHWLLAAVLLLPVPVAAQAAPPADVAAALPTHVAYYQAATGFTRPVYVTHADDGSNRLFVVEQGGVIRVMALDSGFMMRRRSSTSTRASARTPPTTPKKGC